MSGRNPAMDAALSAQELERFQFVKNLREQTPAYLEYVEDRVTDISEEVAARKRAAFQKAQTDLGRYMDMEHNANFYKIRSGDVDRLTKVMEENNNKFAQSRAFDKDITKRQFEINEWYNYNKLETLFFPPGFFHCNAGSGDCDLPSKDGINYKHDGGIGVGSPGYRCDSPGRLSLFLHPAHA
jgi:hypothetical protein